MKINKDLILKYNQPGPRYTSYPPANHFHGDISVDDYKKALCPKLCHFCGCTTAGSKNVKLYQQYVDAVKQEIRNKVEYLDRTRKVTQVHWGGGTPNAIPLSMVEEIMDLFHKYFTYTDNAEIAMECSPANVEKIEEIDELADMGFNRLSFGVQDFNEDVLKIINRDPSILPMEDIINRMKEKGFEGSNLDLVYGLPGQNVENFSESIEKVIELGPERLVTFSYAHVPWVKKAQSILERVGIPTAEEKLEMMSMSYQMLTESGYMPIGMDHYAKPEDSLYQALKTKKLHRNFQGYCTRETTGQVYGFGLSSIDQLENGYYQNAKDVKTYMSKIEESGWATEKGYMVNKDEQVTRSVINEVMCNLFVDFDEVGGQYDLSGQRVRDIVAFNEDKLRPFVQDKLVEIDGNKVSVHGDGFLVIRNIAMAFDPQLSVKENQYSKTI
jgi:oxygen-independent coproporphyrinogen-3 oxidase